MTQSSAVPSTWTVVLPVKSLSTAKSRMGMSARPSSEPLAFAFFKDTVAAAQDCPAVSSIVVATSDALIGDWASARGCLLVDDHGHPGINPAAVFGARLAVPLSGIAVLVSDLPCLTADSLGSVLALAGGHARSFLADLHGTGTTMWLASPGSSVDPRFGPSSRDAHRAAGHLDLIAQHSADVVRLTRARRDVDTDDDLTAAILLGVGPFTADALGLHHAAHR